MNKYFSQYRLPALMVFIIALLGGCAVSSIFTSYPAQINTVKTNIDNKQFKPAREQLAKDTDGADKILYLMEKGRTEQISNNTKSSIQDYSLAMEVIEANEEKARITLSGAGAQAASLMTNDNAIPYEGESYEQIFLHNFQAMNYLFAKNIDAAAVEVRRANEKQTIALREHEDEVDKEKEKEKENLEKNKDFMSNFSALDATAGKVKNSFQNAYTFYVSGVIYELLDEPNDAYIDYKKALEIFSDNIYLQQDVMRLAKQLSMKDDLSRFSKQFKVEPPLINQGDGELVIFFEQGFAPPMLEIRLPIITSAGLQKVAFPTYGPNWIITPPLIITDTSGPQLLGNSMPIVNVQALATKALKERLPGIMIRQILRIVAKKEMVKAASKQSTGFADFLQVVNFVTEKADLRSWLTLPNDAQIFRTRLKAGEHKLQLNNVT
ncbi:MAG: COG3014 family protein, partial [Thiohalomonadales bacterium]